MIYANVELTVEDRKCVANKNIVLYRGDKNVEIRFVIKGNRFTVLDSTYAQMIIRRPSATSVFSDPVLIQNDTVVFTISEDMIDELKEIGSYTFQVRLYDNSMNARATLPPCEGCLIINQPIATEGEALVNAAMINDSAVLAAAYSDVPEDEIFDNNNAYNRTVWVDGDIITDVRMNKIEDALYYINEKGGGGTATAPYISTSLPETVMVGSGEDFELDLDFSSPNLGKGTLKVFINDVDSMNTKIDQGMSITTIPGSLFSKGTNMVVIYVLDRVGMMSNSLTFYIRYGGTEVTSTFDAYTSYDYGATVRYYFTPTALDTSLQLTFYMEIDGVTQAGVPCTSDVRSYYTFPTNLDVGNHYCRAWVTDGTTRSNVLAFNLIILDATSLVVATDTLNPTVEEGTQLVLDYKVYMKNNTSFITKTYVDNNLINTGTCTLETAYYRTTNLTAGTHTIKVEVFDVTETYSDFVTWTVMVTESTYTMLEPATAGSTFIATAYNKSNVDENREVWIGSNQDNQSITASLSNFAFNSENGWIDDALVISGNSWVEIPIQPLANNARYGFTLDIEFKTKAIGVEDAEVLTLWNETDNCGIKITTEQLIMRSKSGSQCDLYFAEDEIVSAIFVIDRDEKTAKIYLNGVMCEAFALSDYEAAGQKFLEDFTVNSNVYLGGYNKNGYCAIKNIRIYEVALATNEILNNFMSNVKDKAAQRELVEFQKGNTLPTLTIYCDFAGLGKDDKKPCNIVYNSPDVNLYGESFTLDGKYSQLQYQGTSSMQYPIKNYRINPRNADGKVKLDPFNNGVGESRFTLKADFMSSGHWQNTGLAKWVNDKLYNYNVNDESTMNARKWYDLQNGGSLKGTRESINGFPCRLILVNDGETALNEGQQEPTPGNTKDMGIFNFNNDKDNVETLGFDTDIFPNCMSFEVTANSDTSAGAFVPYSNTKENYGGIIPLYGDENTTIGISDDYLKSITNSQDLIMDSDATIKSWKLCTKTNADTGESIDVANNVSTTMSNYMMAVADGIRVKFDGKPTYLTINGRYFEIADITETWDVITPDATIINKQAELSYLQNSFELRYPDADDVGSDYGYLGLEMEVLKTDYYVAGGGTIYWSNQIEHDYFGSNELVVSDNVCDVIGYNSSGAMSVIQKVNGKCDIKTSSDYPYIGIRWKEPFTSCTVNGITLYAGEEVSTDAIKKNPYVEKGLSQDYGLKRVIDWVGNCTDEQFVAEFDQYFHRDYTLRYYLLVITLGMVDNLGKNMMFDTFDGKIWLPRFYDMDTICSYDNSGEIKFDVDIEMEQGYWNTSSSRLWTKIRDLMHDELVEKYNNMRQNGMSYESFMSYFYDKQIAQIPQTYYNKDYDVKYAPYADEYMGKAHGDGYEHLKRWLKRRLIFTDTLFDYAPSYTNDALTIRANTLDLMSLEIETYTPVYQHVSFYNGNMEKIKIDGKTSTVFNGTAQTATDQEVLIYGGSNIKAIRGIQSMNPNSMLIGNATRLTELDLSDCPILTVVNSNKANFSPHTYLNKLDISNCPQLGGTLNISNSPLLQEVNALGSAVDNILFPTSVRNLETLRVPKTVTSLTLNDAGLLYTLEMEEGNNLQTISLTNCNNLTETINFDLTQVPTVLLDNSYNGEELYMSDTTNLTLKNMPSLKRVIFTPNSEYSAFDINNILNGANYKITTFNNPMMTDFITTAPHRLSYNNSDVEYEEIDILIPGEVELLDGTYTMGGYWGENGTYTTATDMPHYTAIIPSNIGITSVHIKTSGIVSGNYVRVTFFKDDTFLSRLLIRSTGNEIDQDVDVPTDCNKIIFVCDSNTNHMSSCTYTIPATETIIRKNYGDITPNTAFTANTLDLADTQFQNVKFLCTTDVYNLKVPTTMKNFYCDSAMDIDTDVIEDASYEVIHEELIEPYTTNYEGEVTKNGGTITTELSYTLGTSLNISTGAEQTATNGGITDYIIVSPSTDIVIRWPQLIYSDITCVIYDKDKNILSITNQYGSTATSKTIAVPSNGRYARVSYFNASNPLITYTFQKNVTPNIIPSSANGSLIFNMYSNNTTQPTSTSPYMWDLTGLKLEDFYTYGMNNRLEKIQREISQDNFEFDGGKFAKQEGMTWLTSTFVGVHSNPLMCRLTPIRIPQTTGITVSSNPEYTKTLDVTICRNTGSGWTFSGNPVKITSKDVIHIAFAYQMDASLQYIDMTFDTSGKKYRLYIDEIVNEFEEVEQAEVLTLMKNIDDLIKQPSEDELYYITMPQRMPGYSVRLVNADITPDEYPTMLYPKLIDTTLPITGKLDYTKYNGTSLAWAYAYTTGDVSINPLDSRNQGNITQDYNKLYGTDFVDIVDVWVYKDTDTSKLSTNEAITKAYIELTNGNYKTRVNEILTYYPNCTDVYLFEDGSVTSLKDMFNTNNTIYRNQIVNVAFMDGYFDLLTNLQNGFREMKALKRVNNIPNSVTNMAGCFLSAYGLEHVSNLPSNLETVDNIFTNCNTMTSFPSFPNNGRIKNLTGAFQGCHALTTAPIIPSSVTNMTTTFYECTALTQAPTLPSSVTNMYSTFQGCTSLTQAPVIPDSVTALNQTFQNCTSLTTVTNIPTNCTNFDNTFGGCSNLTSVPTDGWKGNMQYTFAGCKINQQINISSATNLYGTFQNCATLTIPPSLPATANCSMQQCFQNCTSLTQAPTIPNGVTNMNACFKNNINLLTAPNIPESVYAYAEIIYGCKNITSITLPLTNVTAYGGTIRTSGVTDVTWQGLRSNNFDLTLLTPDGATISQQDIQELVPEHLADLSSQGKTATLTLGETYGAYLTPDEVFSANQKGWTIVGASSDFTIVNASVDVSTLTTDESVLSCFIELTSANYRSRVDEVLACYPNCTDLYFFDDGSVTSLNSMIATIGGTNNQTYKGQIQKVIFVDGYFENLTSMNRPFNIMSNLVEVDLNGIKGKITNFGYTFAQCPILETIKMDKLDLSELYDVSHMIYDCPKFNGVVDFSNSPLTMHALANTFRGCKALTITPKLPSMISKGQMSGTFYGCTSLTTPPVIPQGVTNINSAFYDCTSLTTAPVIPSSVTSMEATFRGCTSLTTAPTIPQGVTTMSQTFYYCTSLTTAPTIPQGVTNMLSTFYGCTSLTTPPAIPSSVTNMSSTFQGCTALINGAILHEDVVNTGHLYSGCSSLETIQYPLTNSDGGGGYPVCQGATGKIKEFTWTGERKTNLSVIRMFDVLDRVDTNVKAEWIQDLVPEHLADLTELGTTATLTLGEYASYLSFGEIISAQSKGWTIEGDFSSGDYAMVNASTNLSETNSDITMVVIELTSSNYRSRIGQVLQYYPNCTDLIFFDDGSVTSLYYMMMEVSSTYKSRIKTVEFLDGYFDNLTDMEDTFQGCSALTTVTGIPSSVTKMARCFQNCYRLTTISTMPQGVTDLYETFKSCTSLITAPVLPNNGVTDIRSAFQGCTMLTTVPNLPDGITDMKNTFNGCARLTTVPAIPSSVTNMYSTFYGCSSLTTSPTIPSSVTDMTTTFWTCGSLISANIPSSIKEMDSTFRGCSNLQNITINGSLDNLTKINSLYRACYVIEIVYIPLKSVVNTFDNVLTDTNALKDVVWLGERSSDFNVVALNGKIPQADIKELVNNHLADLTTLGTTATLTLGSTYLAYLTEDEIAQAVAKGWTIQ